MASTPTDMAMIRDITRMGVRAAVLLRGVMLQKIDRPTLEWGLQELSVGDLLDRYFHVLVEIPQNVHLLNLLHIVYSLEGQLDFRVREYGLDSLKDDLNEINFSLQQIGEHYRLDELREPV